MIDYKIGDTIKVSQWGGGTRTVLVTNKEQDVKNGEPGGDGTIGGTDWGVWFYDTQVIEVLVRA